MTVAGRTPGFYLVAFSLVSVFLVIMERLEAYSGVVNNDPHHPVTDHPRKHRKTRPVVYL